MGVIVLAIFLGSSVGSKNSDQVAGSTSFSANGGRLRFYQYFELGQWRADVRTTFGALSYLFQEESGTPPNPGWQPFEVAMPTNSTAAKPQV